MALTYYGQVPTLMCRDTAVSGSRVTLLSTPGSPSTPAIVSYHSHDTAEEHKEPEYLALNPRGQMPILVDGDIVVSESLAALLYLDEAYPKHPLLPSDKRRRALVSLSTGVRQSHTVML